ncbi:MAG: YidH family protein [Paracoccaceae bacterium]
MADDGKAPDKNRLAKDRTDWAEDRTVLANERTFAGWMRTGMAAVALALGLRALFDEFEPAWLPKVVASFLIAIAIGVFLSAWRNSAAAGRRLHEHATESKSDAAMGLISAALSLAAVATGAILWYL